jgi:hypothetical protein
MFDKLPFAKTLRAPAMAVSGRVSFIVSIPITARIPGASWQTRAPSRLHYFAAGAESARSFNARHCLTPDRGPGAD